MARSPAPLPQTPASRAADLRSVVDRRVGESRFRAALTRDLLVDRDARRLPAGV